MPCFVLWLVGSGGVAQAWKCNFVCAVDCTYVHKCDIQCAPVRTAQIKLASPTMRCLIMPTHMLFFFNSEIQFQIYSFIKFSYSNDLTPHSAVVEKIFALTSDCKTRVVGMKSD
jgi:hypothetical protein